MITTLYQCYFLFLSGDSTQVTLHQYHNYQENVTIDNNLKSSIFSKIDVL